MCLKGHGMVTCQAQSRWEAVWRAALPSLAPDLPQPCLGPNLLHPATSTKASGARSPLVTLEHATPWPSMGVPGTWAQEGLLGPWVLPSPEDSGSLSPEEVTAQLGFPWAPGAVRKVLGELTSWSGPPIG